MRFAERCFINAQELIRFMDQKAGLILAAVGILSGALGVFLTSTKDLVPGDANQGGFLLFARAVSILFFGYAAAVVWYASQTYHARSSAEGEGIPASLIFPLSILGLEAPAYNQRVAGLSHQEILQEFGSQVVTLSSIYKIKQERINRATHLFEWLAIWWVVSIALLAISLVAVHR